jgi:hypothetical protein
MKSAGAPAGSQNGDENLFQLHAAETENWVDQIVKPAQSHRHRRRWPAALAAPAALVNLLEQIRRSLIPLA